ncbi:MAG: hypothetical protein ABEJ76_01980 [Halanaeroarchaeum sp.]
MSDEPAERDLEGRVRELEETVRGLTAELVDATERINQLEDALADEQADEDADDAPEEWVPAAEEMTDDARTESEDDEESTLADDIIVA